MVLELKIFFEVVERNGLVSAEQLSSLKSKLNKESLSPGDLEELVSGSYLTKWQAQRLSAGKHNFIVGEYKLVDFLGKDAFGEVYQVEHKVSAQRNRLRLLSKEISADEKRLLEYLDRVKAFQAISNPRISKVIEITEVGGRNIIVTECTPGQTLVERLAGNRQNSKLVEKLIEKLTRTVAELEAAELTHGTINGYSISITDKQKVVLDLPGEIGFCGAPKNKSKSDIASLGWLACGLLSGDFEKPQITGNQTADKFFEIASHPQPKIEDIRSVLGGIPAVAPEIPPELSPGIPPGIPAGMDIPSTPSSADPALPAENLSENDAQTTAEAPQEFGLEIPQIPNVNAEQLESIGEPEEMFGDFENIEVVSEIRSSQPFAKANPIVVDTGSVSVKPLIKPESKDKKKKPINDQDTESKSSKKIVLASLGGVVGIAVIGLSIYFFLQGGGPQVARSDSKEELQKTGSGDADAKTEKDSKKTPQADQKGDAKNKQPALQDKEGSGIITPVDPMGTQPGNQGEKQPVPNNLPGTDPGNLSENKPTPQPNPNPQENPSPEKKDGKISGGESKGKGPGKGPGKGKKKEETPIDLFKNSDGGKNAEKERKGNGTSSKFANPFVKAPAYVSLAPAKKGEDNSRVQTFFPLRVPAGFPLAVRLHGGERATKAKIKFTLRASTSIDGTWHVSAGAKGSAKVIAKFTFDGQGFGFAWEKEAESLVNSIYLSNCAVEIKAAQYQHIFALRPPVVATQLEFGKSLNATAEAKLNYLPNMESVKIVLVDIPKSFAKFDYSKNKPFLTGRADNSALQFKEANIEYVRGLLRSSLSGSKISVSLKPHFITRAKVPVPLTTFQQFEQFFKNAINAGTRLEATYKELKKQHDRLGNNTQAKGQFNKVYGMKERELQVKEIPRDKEHLDKALNVLKSIHQAKIGIRIFYQAGEVEVDLATPDGKKYSPPKPAAKKPGPAKEKAKKTKKKAKKK